MVVTLHRVRIRVNYQRRVKLQAFDLHTVFGLDNPADTGMAYGFLAPLLVMAEARGLNIECRPMFLEPGLRGTCNVTLAGSSARGGRRGDGVSRVTCRHSCGRCCVAGQDMNDRRSIEQVSVGDVQIEVVARVVVQVEDVCGAIVGVALKVPTAIVARSPAGTWEVALD